MVKMMNHEDTKDTKVMYEDEPRRPKGHKGNVRR